MLDDAIVIPRLLIGGLESPTRSRLSPRVGHVVLRPHDVRAPPLPAAHEYSPRHNEARNSPRLPPPRPPPSMPTAGFERRFTRVLI